MNNNNLVLAVDTSISNGSFSLWENDFEINSYIGDKSISRSEDILIVVDKLITDVGFVKSDITKVLFTNGPGSYTGLRVGVSTVLGLCFALNCSYQSYSVLEIFTSMLTQNSGNLFCAVQAGREEVVYQVFKKEFNYIKKVGQIKKLKLTKFNKLITKKSFDTIITEKRLANRISIDKDIKLTLASDNVSNLIYKYYLNNKNFRRENTLTLNYGGSF